MVKYYVANEWEWLQMTWYTMEKNLSLNESDQQLIVPWLLTYN